MDESGWEKSPDDFRRVLESISKTFQQKARERSQRGSYCDPDFADAIQEVLIEFWEKLADHAEFERLRQTFQSADHLRNAILKTAWLRKRGINDDKLDGSKPQRVFRRAIQNGRLEVADPRTRSDGPTPAAAIVLREDVGSLAERLRKNPDVLQSSIDSLPSQQRTMILCLAEGIDKSQTCDALGIKPVSYEKVKSRSQASLRERLASKGFPLDTLPLLIPVVRELRNELTGLSKQSTSQTSKLEVGAR